MSQSSSHRSPIPVAWQFALVGVVAAVVLTLGLQEAWDVGGNIEGGIVLFGPFLAGLLAARYSAGLIAAGLYAGLLSGIVLAHPFILGILLLRIGDGGTQVVLFALLSTVATVCFATVFGAIAGQVGGLIGTATARQRTDQ
jgi:hypothetical protein